MDAEEAHTTNPTNRVVSPHGQDVMPAVIDRPRLDGTHVCDGDIGPGLILNFNFVAASRALAARDPQSALGTLVSR